MDATKLHAVYSELYCMQYRITNTTSCSSSTSQCNKLFLSLDAKLPKIQSVAVTPGYVGTSPNANPSLEVTWSAVDDPAVSYVVRYSQSMGTVTAPPDGASEMSSNGNSVTLWRSHYSVVNMGTQRSLALGNNSITSTTTNHNLEYGP